MSGAAGRDIQRTARSKAGFITAAALFYLSSAMETAAGPAANEQPPAAGADPAPQQTAPEQGSATSQASFDATPAATSSFCWGPS
jgi:hypothetical protein